jgi:transposase
VLHASTEQTTANKSQIAHSALEQIARVYDIEREIKELDPDARRRIRHERSKPLLDALHQWMILNRQKVPDGSATAKALDYSLRRWSALTRFVGDGQLPVDNNHIENQIRPIAIGRSNWLVCGFTARGQARGSGDESDSECQAQWARSVCLLEGCFDQLPTQRNSQIADLLPHRWQPQAHP